MKVNFDTEITQLNGKPILIEDEKATLRSVCVAALYLLYKDEVQMSSGNKFKRYQLAKKVFKATKETDMTIEELSEIKTVIAKNYGPMILGPVYNILEGEKEQQVSS